MAAKQTLTRDEGYTLQDTHQAARLSMDTLATRTAYYEWNETANCWEATHSGMRIQHVRNSARGFRWNSTTKRFETCTCHVCSK